MIDIILFFPFFASIREYFPVVSSKLAIFLWKWYDFPKIFRSFSLNRSFVTLVI